jgi:hypothetical protein
MNSKQVLDKIISLLSSDKKEEVILTYAKLKDGTIVESPTFDVGEPVEVVSEDGKTPAPNGEHELVLRDESGNENIIKIRTEDGVIVERENVEDSQNEEMKAEDVKVQPLPGESNVIGDDKKEEKMGDVEPLPSGDGVEEEVEPLPGEEGSPFDFKSEMEKMTYRIEELEKKLAKMAEVEVKEEDDIEEEKLPKLDGAPVEETKMSAMYKANNKNLEGNTQNKFLSRLYK